MEDPRVSLRRLRDSLEDRVDLVEVDELFAVGEWHVGFEMRGRSCCGCSRWVTTSRP